MREAERTRKLTKFGSVKYVYPRDLMQAMREEISAAVSRELPGARLLYWT
jgi:spore photoproduct lyase